MRLDETRLAACWGAAALLVICLLPLASHMPDGYEGSAERSGMTALVAADPADIVAVGRSNAVVADWQNEFVRHIQTVLGSEQLLALVSTVFAGLAAWGVGRIVARRATNPA